MSHFRQDILTGRWVIMAAGRQDRPNEFSLNPPSPTDPGACPFCPGHEDQTTPEIMAAGRPDPGDRSGWRVRVFPNMYPALEAGQEPDSAPAGDGDLFPAQSALGGHEVVVCTPEHSGSLGQMTVPHLAELLVVVRDRAVAMAAAVPGMAHVLPFCNHGPQAGATLAHPHLQILASPLIPALVKEKAARLAEHRQGTGRCLVCDVLAAEEKAGDRVITRNAGWTLVAPWASAFPYQMTAIPREHASRLEEASPADLAGLADVLKTGLERLEQIHQNLSYNLIVHSGAGREDGTPGGQAAASPGFHWQVEVLPRLARLAGFEAGSGFAINSIKPETAASRLRGEG